MWDCLRACISERNNDVLFFGICSLPVRTLCCCDGCAPLSGDVLCFFVVLPLCFCLCSFVLLVVVFLSFMAEVDIDFYNLNVSVDFVEKQLQWFLLSRLVKIRVETKDMLQICAHPALVLIPANRKGDLIQALKGRVDGIRPHQNASVFLACERTIFGCDLAQALRACGIEV